MIVRNRKEVVPLGKDVDVKRVVGARLMHGGFDNRRKADP